MQTLIRISLIFLTSSFWCVSSFAQSIVLKDAREAPTPIALQAFVKSGESGDIVKFASDTEANVTADLIFSRVFKVIPAEAFGNTPVPGNLKSFQVDPWRQVGAQYVVRAKVGIEKGESWVEGYAFDVMTGKMILEKRYKSKRNPSSLPHQFADDIVEIVTGQKGLFSTKIAFAYIPPKARNKEIWVMDFNGRNPYPLVQNGRQNLTPRWSPDGRNIYFTSSSLMDWHIWRTTLDKKTAQITKFRGSAISPTPLPNGREMIISSSKDGDPELYTMSMDGQIKQRLTKSRGADIAPSMGQDGRTICFSTERWGNLHVAALNLGNLEVRRLTRVGTLNDTCSWNPRDNLILFSGMDTDREFDVFAMNDQGNDMERLTYDASFNEAPHWSPDGKLIVFSSRRALGGGRGSRSQIYVMKADGTQVGVIAELPGDATQPNWSPRLGYE